jgi:sucrose-6-phosphate hydrolase SacC (GH32 family)
MPYSIGTSSAGSSINISSTTVEKVIESQAFDLEARASQMRAICPSGFLPPHKSISNGSFQGGVGEVVDASGYGSFYDTPFSYRSVHAGLSALTVSQSPLPLNFVNVFETTEARRVICVNGYSIVLEQQITKGANYRFELPDAPATGSRQDLVMMEVWKEEVTPGANDDCFFPYGNVGYDAYDQEGTYDGCALLNADVTGGNWPAYMNNGHGNPSKDSSLHGDYVRADDANIEQFINNPDNNIGLTDDGKYYQVRYRIVTLEDSMVVSEHLGGNDPYIMNAAGSSWVAPQGQLASRPANGSPTNSNGILWKQIGTETTSSMNLDGGMYVGGQYSARTNPMTGISTLSLDGFINMIPICKVQRRNSTAYSDNNQNGGVAASVGTSDRPDGRFYDLFYADDILDLRHRVSPNGFDVEALQQESIQQLLKSDLATSWEKSYSVSGSDLITNGTFDTDSGWTKGAGWTISGGKAHYTGGGYSQLYQSPGFVAGKYYRIIVDLTGSSGVARLHMDYPNATSGWQAADTIQYDFYYSGANGTVQIEFGGDGGVVDNVKAFEIVPVYSTRPLVREAIGNPQSGIATIQTTCNNGISSAPNGIRSYYSDQAGEQTILDHIIDVDSFSETAVNSNSGFDSAAGWDLNNTTISGGVAHFTGGGGASVVLSGSVGNFVIGDYYKVSFDIVTQTSGNLYWHMGNATHAAVSGVGTHTAVGRAADGALYVDTAGFVGTIDNLQFTKLNTNAVAIMDASAKKIYLDASYLNDDTGNRPQFSGRKPVVTWDDSGKEVNVDWDSVVDTMVGNIQQSTDVILAQAGAITAENGDVYQSPNGVNVTISGSIAASGWEVSGSFTGTTVPNVGTYTKISGSGPASFGTNNINIGQKYAGWQAGANVIETGEGYDLHAGSGMFINSYVKFKAGSGFLSRVPHDSNDSIIQSQYYIDGTQVIPNDGIGYIPFGSPVDVENKTGSLLDSHTKSTSLSGFINMTSINVGGLDINTASEGAAIIKDGSTYKMWIPTDGIPGVNIRLYTSTDLVTWTEVGVVITVGAEGTYDGTYLSTATVIKDGSTYKMWYGGHGGDMWRIIYATSTDGITWSNHQLALTNGAGFDSGSIYAPCVIKDGSTYKMWYHGYNGSHGVGYATSADGITWSRSSTPVINRRVGSLWSVDTTSPRVIKDGSIYKMFFSGSNGITGNLFYTISTDGITWNDPIVIFDNDTLSSNTPCMTVFKDESAYRFILSTYPGAYPVKLLAGTLSMADENNVGGDGTLVGLYPTEGNLNCAPIANSSVVLTYNHRALQQDWSRLGGAQHNYTASYALRSISEHAIVTTMGTGANPKFGHISNYRDFISNLVPVDGPDYNFDSSEIVYNSQGSSYNYEIIDRIESEATFNSKIEYGIDGYAADPTELINVGDFISTSSFYKRDNVIVDGHCGLFGYDKNIQISNIGNFNNTFEFIYGIAEKNKEMFIIGGSHNGPHEQQVMLFNLIGRPIVK